MFSAVSGLPEAANIRVHGSLADCFGPYHVVTMLDATRHAGCAKRRANLLNDLLAIFVLGPLDAHRRIKVVERFDCFLVDLVSAEHLGLGEALRLDRFSLYGLYEVRVCVRDLRLGSLVGEPIGNSSSYPDNCQSAKQQDALHVNRVHDSGIGRNTPRIMGVEADTEVQAADTNRYPVSGLLLFFQNDPPPHPRLSCEVTTMIAGIATVLAAVALQGSAMDTALIDGDRAHVFLPRVLVSEGEAVSASWSDDGQYLIVVSVDVAAPPSFYKASIEGGPKQAPPAASITIHSYSVRTGVSKKLWSEKGAYGTRASSEFFAGSDIAVVQVNGPAETRVYRVIAGTSKVEFIETLSWPSSLLLADPAGKYMAVVQGPAGLSMSVRFLTPIGNLPVRQQIPKNSSLRWGVGSVPFLIHGAERQITIVNPAGGLQNAGQAPQEAKRAEPSPKIQADTNPFPMPGREETVNIVTAYVRDNPRRVVVGFEATSPLGSPTDTGVFFRGGLQNFVRPVIQVSKSALDEMIAKGERAKIMAEVNQIGRALIMYAADNDDRFPTQEEFDSGATDPYLKRSGMTEGFVYRPGPMSNNPAEAELGYRLCPGGRVVVYQDGHTSYVPDR